MGVRRELVLRAGGYSGDVMFENLELERTVRASGGGVCVPLDLYVRRLPPSTRQFLGQRVRQAYDELARPSRLSMELAVVPGLLVARRHPRTLAAAALSLSLVAEMGRRRAGGRRYFAASAIWFAPLWVLERGVCAWLALAARALFGGIPYRGRIVPRAATPQRELRVRLQRSAA